MVNTSIHPAGLPCMGPGPETITIQELVWSLRFSEREARPGASILATVSISVLPSKKCTVRRGKLARPLPTNRHPLSRRKSAARFGLTIIHGAQIVFVWTDGPPPSELPSARLGPRRSGGPIFCYCLDFCIFDRFGVGKTAPGQSAPTVETEERRSIGLAIIRGAQIASNSGHRPHHL